MNKLLNMIVLLVQIGGGLFGLSLIVPSFFTGQLTQNTMIIHGIFAFIFSFGIIAGAVLFFKPGLGLVLSAIFQAIQIPVVTVSAVAYSLSSGACFNLYKHATGWGFNFFLGSHYSFYLKSGQPWLLGINIVALVLFVYLVKEIWLTPSAKKSSEFQPCSGYSAFRYSKRQTHPDNSSPLRHAAH